MNVNKFQQGGPTFVAPKWGGVSGSQSASAPASAKSNKDNSNVLGDLLEKISGLPSDIVALKSVVDHLTLGSDGKISTDSASYRYLVSQIAITAVNKKLADQAVDFVKNNGSIREYALTNNGGIYVYKNTADGARKLEVVSIRDFDATKYLPAYVSDLINERSNNPKYANNNELLTTIQDSIGRDQIFSKIEKIVNNVKFSSVENVTNSVLKDVKSGIAQIEGISSDGHSAYWGNAQEVSTKYNQATIDPRTGQPVADPNINRAFQHIYGSLSDKEKALLLLIGREQGKSIQDIIFNIIALQNEQVTKVSDQKISLSKDAATKGSKSGSGGSSDGISGVVNNTQADVIQHDIGERFEGDISIGNAKIHVRNGAITSRSILSAKGDIMSHASILDILTNSQIAPAIDKNSVYFGNTKMTTASLDYLAYRDNGYRTMYLPFIKDAQGSVKPNFAKWKQIENAETAIKKSGIKKTADNFEKIKQMYIDAGAGDMLDYAYVNAPVSAGGITQEEQNTAKENMRRKATLRKFVFIDAIGSQNLLEDYGANRVEGGEYAIFHNIAYHRDSPAASLVQKEYNNIFLGNITEKDLDAGNVKNNIKNIADEGNTDLLESSIYAPVNDDYVTTGLISQRMVEPKQTPGYFDEKTQRFSKEDAPLYTGSDVK